MESSPPIAPRNRLQLQRGRSGQFSPLELIVLGLCFLIASFGAYQAYARASGLNDESTSDTQSAWIPAFTRTLTSSITTSGTVVANQSVDLNFGSTGKVAAINVALGDQVTAGQELASLDKTQLESALRSAETNLASAQAKLDATINPSTGARAKAEQAILDAQNQLSTAQKNLDDLRLKPTASDISGAQQAVNTAQSNLQSAQDNVLQAQRDVTNAQSALNEAQTALDEAYDNLRKAHDDLEDAEDDCDDAPSTPGLPSNGAKAAFAPFVSTSIDCGEDDSTPEPTTTPGTGSTDGSARSTYTSANSSYGSAANAYNTALDAVETQQTALTTAQNALTNGNLDRAIQNAQLALDTAQTDLSNTMAGPTDLDIATAENTVSAAHATLITAEEAYAALLNPGADVTLPLQSAVDSAADNVETAQDNLDAAIITAPFDGTITAVNATVGDTATGASSSTGASSVFTLLNPDLIRIDASVDQTDVSSLKAGQSATATFDALEGYTYPATVSNVGLTPATSSGVVTYVVQFAVDTSQLPEGTPIPVQGMTASLTVTTATAANATVVPSRAVTGSGANATVTVRNENGEEEQRRVTTGISNGTLTEITSGLEPGDEVLYTITTSSSSSTGTQEEQLPGGGNITFSPGGGGGGGGPVIIGP